MNLDGARAKCVLWRFGYCALNAWCKLGMGHPGPCSSSTGVKNRDQVRYITRAHLRSFRGSVFSAVEHLSANVGVCHIAGPCSRTGDIVGLMVADAAKAPYPRA